MIIDNTVQFLNLWLMLEMITCYIVQEYSVEFSSYFNVMWEEPRLEIPELFLTDINSTSYSEQVKDKGYSLISPLLSPFLIWQRPLEMR